MSDEEYFSNESESPPKGLLWYQEQLADAVAKHLGMCEAERKSFLEFCGCVVGLLETGQELPVIEGQRGKQGGK